MTFSVKDLCVFRGKKALLCNVSVDVPCTAVTCIIGPSGAGKSTFIRTLNRINEEHDGFRKTGSVLFHEDDVFSMNVYDVRHRIGMVFQKPCVFPRSIFENVAFGVKHFRNKDEIASIVADKLRAVSLWEEVKNRLHDKAYTLSVGQQQRLCIARTLAVEPEVILMDEPTSALDPAATAAIERLILELRKKYTILVVTHDLEQAKAIADHVLYFSQGKLLVSGSKEVLLQPEHEELAQYVKSHKKSRS